MESISKNIIELKCIGENILSYKPIINDKIEGILSLIKKTDKDRTKLLELTTFLQEDTTGIGPMIVHEYKAFKFMSIIGFNIETKRKDIYYVLENLSDNSYLDKYCIIKEDGSREAQCKESVSDPKKLDFCCNKSIQRSCHCDLKNLLDSFTRFEKKYKDLIKKFLIKKDKDLIIREILVETNIQKKNVTQEEVLAMDKKVKDKLISLISCVFAVWTIKNSDYYLEMLNTNDAEDYQLIPHAAQVIAIFRILGIGYREPPNSNDLIHKLKSFVSFPEWKSTNGLKNHLAQVSTGQGKSIVLAVLSTVLALLDFDISCACYSQFLSQRDLLAFTEIFDAFGVSKNIHYSTFNKLCENIINQNGDVRQRILDLVTNADICRNTSIEKKPKLLLIDEVDIFFLDSTIDLLTGIV